MRIVRPRTKRGLLMKRRELNRLRRDVNVLKSNVDLKFNDIANNDSVVATTGIVILAFTIADGNTQSQKDGLKITIKSIRIRYQLKLPATSTIADGTDICRILLVKDKQCNGALPAVSDILAGTDIQNHKNLENSKRFTILSDRTITINSLGSHGNGSTNSTLPASKSWQYFKRMNLPILYNNSGTTGAIGTINSNCLYNVFISEFGKCGIEATVRVRYAD